MPIVNVEETVKSPFDYVVIGGGTAGLTVAARLSEDPSVKVLVLEAGEENLNDPLIEVPAQFLRTFGNPKYDWAFPVVKQKHANNIEHMWQRGKGLGGSSGMNFFAWIKPPAEDINAYEKLGNRGWNWAEYEKYSKRSETFHPPTKEQTDLYPHKFIVEHRGTTGPIQVAISHSVHTLDELFQETMVNKGLKEVDDPYDGDMTGTWIASSSIDPRTWTRSYSANTYLVPNLKRENLSVLTGAYVSKVLLNESEGNDDRIVNGVEFIHDGTKHKVMVDKEVILSAGSIKSPQILELSGIGNPDILEPLGIKVEISLPGVGENVQEHYGCPVTFELDPKIPHETLDFLRDPEYAAKQIELHALGKGAFRKGLTSFAYFPLTAIDRSEALRIISQAEEEVKALEKSGTLRPGIKEQLDIQLDILKDEKVPDCEIVVMPFFASRAVAPEPGKLYTTLVGILNHPMSRGTIHIQSSDPLLNPTIDPHYLESETDLEVLAQHVKFIKSLADTEPWKSGIIRETDPGEHLKTDNEIKEYVKNCIATIWHTTGSCSMLPREKEGVVDYNLKVYGTKNLRVVDLSVLPLQIAAHTQATAYFVGEKGENTR
ncbi:GMC oxidoreductase family protein Mala s 12 [Psilocybe cubensis]|uniref:GMC oxidoreductase family protein Mala s 12 n=2 Tax=Psilocybe cubensis TaxID=181762 RepID=A0ACB8GM65_PSICU|nr:GMC oxidoreductase family protein Mala s 12 [Psilocybe cubensis]KAH9476793.1 GMC oxidoreductase family protein Mala s 12 [Psilocybe cubensis]